MSGVSGLSGLSSVFSQRSVQAPSFTKLDSNGDGSLKLDELKAGVSSGTGEAQSRLQAMFSEMDGDGDGSVTSAEKDTFDATIQQRMQATGFMVQLMSSGPPDLASLLAESDSDEDGSVSKSEFSSVTSETGSGEALMDALFAAIDSDEDGSLSQEEAKAFEPPEPAFSADLLSALRGGYGQSGTSQSSLLDILSAGLDKAA